MLLMRLFSRLEHNVYYFQGLCTKAMLTYGLHLILALIDLIREEPTNFPLHFSLRKTANPIIIKSLQKLESVIGRKLIKE